MFENNVFLFVFIASQTCSSTVLLISESGNTAFTLSFKPKTVEPSFTQVSSYQCAIYLYIQLAFSSDYRLNLSIETTFIASTTRLSDYCCDH